MMGATYMPYVAIIGGFWALKENNPKAFDDAKGLASELGAELAKKNLRLVVYWSNDESLEPHVVSGYVKSLPAEARNRILVRFPESQRNKVQFAEQSTRKELFEQKLFPGRNWEAPFYRSLVEADGVDGVLLMAGGNSVLIAGQIAIARSLPTLAIETFDGSAATIRTELAVGRSDYPAATTHTAADLIEWLDSKIAANAKERETRRLQEIRYKTYVMQATKGRWLAGAFLALLAIVFVAIVKAPNPTHYVFLMIIGLVVAGATGALARSVIWGAEETSSSISFLLGGLAAFVVGLASLVPQWIGSQGLLSPSTKAIGAPDKIQFFAAMLVALSAGLGFDSVFTRLKRQAESQPVAVAQK